MKFECVLLKAGNGHFKVESAEDGFSKSGNPMLILKIRLYDYENTDSVITEYLTAPLLYKARSLLRAGGMALPHGQTKAEWGIVDFEGKEGKCEIGVEPPQGKFPPKNIIKAYLEPQAGSLPPQQPMVNPPQGVAMPRLDGTPPPSGQRSVSDHNDPFPEDLTGWP